MAFEHLSIFPMHLVISRDGRIFSAGRTISKMIGDQKFFQHVFGIDSGIELFNAGDFDAERLSGPSICVRSLMFNDLCLQGSSSRSGNFYILNFGFGMGLRTAVERLNLVRGDFAPSDPSLDFLLIGEAMRAATAEINHLADRVDTARISAEKHAVTDPLTGILNRRGFELEMARAIRRFGTSPFSLFQLDVDDFKQINDAHGHLFGDLCLRHVADVLRVNLGEKGVCGRVGGDEFSALVFGNFTLDQLGRLKEKILLAISSPLYSQKSKVHISACIGYWRANDLVNLDAASLWHAADLALYSEKK
ncbi:GGDEF domain-containing protein [Paracoccus ravus]|uniref:GGDEF domain-containing protein n=1 Tax=Paracoccus ravus TaxID=2447760 RepID=UPI00106EFE58|nr:GGDEF domain-containing protein [Paracoccus ravus]